MRHRRALLARHCVENVDDFDVQMLKEVVAALGRLDRGDYGWCTSCMERIDDVQLEAIPIAALCSQCDDDLRPTLSLAIERL